MINFDIKNEFTMFTCVCVNLCDCINVSAIMHVGLYVYVFTNIQYRLYSLSKGHGRRALNQNRICPCVEVCNYLHLLTFSWDWSSVFFHFLFSFIYLLSNKIQNFPLKLKSVILIAAAAAAAILKSFDELHFWIIAKKK